MPVIDIPFGPAGPRRPGGPRKLPPHPASGRAPDLMDILAEAGSLRPPNPELIPITPEEQGLVEGMVNDPRAGNFPPALMEPEALGIAATHGATGSLPALRRTLMQSLSDMIIQQLDVEAAINPTLGRELARGPGLATMDEIMGSAKGHGRLSDFFLGASPVDNPEKIAQGIEEIRAGLDRLEPEVTYGDQTAVLEHSAGIFEADPDLDARARSELDAYGGSTSSIEELLYNLEEVLNINAMQDPIQSQRQLLMFLRDLNPSLLPEEKIRRALMEATELSNIGSGQQLPGSDPTTQASLAGDFDPVQLRRQLSGPNADPDLIMRMMGVGQQQFPRRNV